MYLDKLNTPVDPRSPRVTVVLAVWNMECRSRPLIRMGREAVESPRPCDLWYLFLEIIGLLFAQSQYLPSLKVGSFFIKVKVANLYTVPAGVFCFLR